MKKTYKNMLPKGMEVKSTNVRIENGEVFVDVEFKEKLEFKDGDFLVNKGNGNCFIYSNKPAFLHDTVCAYCGSYDNKIGCIEIKFSNNWLGKEECRYATAEEKSAFLERLEKECGKRWNPDTKELEDIRWTPKDGERYWCINTAGDVVMNTYNDSNILDIQRSAIGNCFKYKKVAMPYADQIKEIFKNSKYE